MNAVGNGEHSMKNKSNAERNSINGITIEFNGK